MSKYNVKNYFKTLAQLPIIYTFYAVVRIGGFLEICLVRLDNPISSPGQELYRVLTKDISKEQESLLSIGAIMKLMEKKSDAHVEIFREKYEESEAGHYAKTHNPDKKLYAVLKPNREENLSRIRNVLYSTDPELLNKVLVKMKAILE